MRDTTNTEQSDHAPNWLADLSMLAEQISNNFLILLDPPNPEYRPHMSTRGRAVLEATGLYTMPVELADGSRWLYVSPLPIDALEAIRAAHNRLYNVHTVYGMNDGADRHAQATAAQAMADGLQVK